MDAVIANEPLDTQKVQTAETIIGGLIDELPTCVATGAGPFLEAVYDEAGRLIAKTPNTVVLDQCSHHHAEINAIAAAQRALGTYDLTPYRLSLYVTAEPCMMCLGAVLWSGIRAVYYSVPSEKVSEITGFDEGFKPNWLAEFRARGITVYGGVCQSVGAAALRAYVAAGGVIYNPKR